MSASKRGEPGIKPTPEPDASHRDEKQWWKSVTIYQIWPHSFLDTTGSGHGDLRGIITKVPYFVSLGVDAIWLSPMYSSPMVDMGYDVSDYRSVNPMYGTMQDMEELIHDCHENGIKVLLDLVINHTSDQHDWFRQSKMSRNGEFADYYIWRDPKYDAQGVKREPNNWGSCFGGSAWEWVEERQQYYLHLFAKGQPDLNWEPREVRESLYEDAIRFWLRKGVDGFRADACDLYSKDQTFPDGQLGLPFGFGDDYGNWFPIVKRGPRLLTFWHEIRDEIMSEFKEAIIIGESGGPLSETLDLVGGGPGHRSMVMLFDPVILSVARQRSNFLLRRSFKLSEVKEAVGGLEDLVNLREQQGWTAVWKENHDRSRSASEFGSKDTKFHARSAKLLAMWTASLSGTLAIYQGEEIGMTNLPSDWTADDFRDTWTVQYLKKVAETNPDNPQAQKEALQALLKTSRDNSRTPVQWSAETNAGFTSGAPWIRINPNYNEINVSDQLKDEDSVWHFWRKVLELRKGYAHAFVHGTYSVLDFEDEGRYTYMRQSDDGRRVLVTLNFTDQVIDTPIPFPSKTNWKLLFSNVEDPKDKPEPWEGRFYTEIT